MDPERLAVVVGTGTGGALTLLGQDDVLEASGVRKVSPHTVPMRMANGPAAWVSIELGARGGAHTPVSACASGGEALSLALDLIRLGRADVVVAGGTEACVHPLPLAGFAQAKAHSTRNDDPAAASRPFDTGRDGFVIGEGAGLVVLERAEFAAARGARVYARLAGAGVTSDAHHVTAAHAPGQVRAIWTALASAGLAPSDVTLVHAHATSTQAGDLVEARSIAEAVGTHAAVTATRSMTGHPFGAAGAVGAIAAVRAVYEGWSRRRAILSPRTRRSAWTWSRAAPAGCRCPPHWRTPSASAATTPSCSSPPPDRIPDPAPGGRGQARQPLRGAVATRTASSPSRATLPGEPSGSKIIPWRVSGVSGSCHSPATRASPPAPSPWSYSRGGESRPSVPQQP
ncbi:beta-ketoacyl synthase N-terminal-like domain-containing protein [Streptomyces sp. NPDC090045]|uniref:beta-ketoacyl-[acyl-carrier-protein] synthase family protein n=1 Tax=Streptomyces sp. NPDC090045 TaxID=3365927 RepID=UPI0037F61090